MSRFLTLMLLVLTSAAFCTERETIRDAHGKVVGSATTDGNRTVYRDASGKVTGSATTSGNRTVYRDASGKTVGTATESGNRTTYRGAQGKAGLAATRLSVPYIFTISRKKRRVFIFFPKKTFTLLCRLRSDATEPV